MSKKCRRCGQENDDERHFCKQCGEPLDENIRLLMDYERIKKTPSKVKQAAPKKDDDNYVYVKREKKKKSYAIWWAVGACVVVVVGIALYFLLAQ